MTNRNSSQITTRELIAEAAAEVFLNKGFDAASVRDIAKAAGISQGTLYYHIGSKAELLLVLHDSFVDEMISRLDEVVESNLDAEAKLRKFVHAMFHTLETKGDRMALYLRERQALSPEGVAHIRPKADHIDGTLQAILEQGAAEGRWRDGISIRSTKLAIFGMVSWAVEWFNPQGEKSADGFADDFLDLIFNGLLN